MAFGGGGSADYQANLIINTSAGERQLQSFSGKMQRALGAVSKNMNANVGQSLRETDRALKKLDDDLSSLRARFQSLNKQQIQETAAAAKATAALSKQRTELSDLSRQGRATTADMLRLAKALEAAAKATPPVRGRAGRASNLDSIAKQVRARAAENPGVVRTTQPLNKIHMANAEYMDALKEQAAFNKLWTSQVAADFDAQQAYYDKNAAARMANVERIAAINQKAAQNSAEYVSAQQASSAKERADGAAYIKWWDTQLAAQERLAAREERIQQRRERAAMKALAAPFKGAKDLTVTAPRRGFLGRIGLRTSKTTMLDGAGGGGGGGKGGRTSGGGHGGWEDSEGKERGQLMPTRSKAAAKALLGLSSAAQGAMLGIAALDGNVVGLGFSLIFLGYGVVSVALAFAALTAAVVVTERFFKTVITQGAKAGAQMEKLGQQMTSYFKDSARAQANLTKASKFSRTFGIDPEAARQAIFDLDKMGMATDGYMEAVANAAAGTGKQVTDVTERWMEIQKANAADRKGLMESFSKDFDIEAKNYSSSLELMTALNQRWGGAAENAANTQIGMIARIKATWTDLMTSVGSVLEGFFKPILILALKFTEAMVSGFQDAKKTGEKTGDLQKNMDEFAATIRAITPMAQKFGYIMGKVVYYGLLIVAKVVKVVADTLIRLWNKIKPVIDTIRAWIPKIKELIDNIITWYHHNETLINTIAAILLALLAFELGSRALIGVLQSLWGMVVAVGEAIGALGEILKNTNLYKTGKIVMEGIQEALDAIESVAKKLDSLGNKIVTLGLAGFDNFMGLLDKIKDKLDSIKDKVTNIGGDEKGSTPSTGPSLPKFDIKDYLTPMLNGLAQFTDEFAAGLALMLRLAAAHPLVAAAIAAVGLVILAGIFPKETGQVTHIGADWLLTIITYMIAIPVRMALRMAAAWMDMWDIVFRETAKFIYNFLKGLVDIIVDLVKGVFGGLADIVMGILTGDWARVFEGAKKVLSAIFVQLPEDLFKLFFDTAIDLITVHIPNIAKVLWEGITSVFEPITELIKEPLSKAWEWFKGWVDQFKVGWGEESFKNFRNAISENLDGIWTDFKDLFDFSGAKAIGKMVRSAFDDIANALSFMPNPFHKIIEWLDPIIDKLKEAKSWIDKVNPFDRGGGGSSSSSGGGGSKSQSEPAKWVAAYISDAALLYDGVNSRYTVVKSHWSDQPEYRVQVQTTGTSIPDLSKYALGGVVPGRPGTKVPVLADAGEVFLGRPNLARGSGREASALGGGGGVHIYLDARGSVMTNDVIDKLGNMVASKLIGSLAGNRAMSFHRIGG